MKAVTIDKLDLKDHVRWAQDQQIHDPSFVKDAEAISTQSEVMGVSVIYPSQLDELFEWQKGSHHWASFAPPGNIPFLPKRLFSFRLFPNSHFASAEDAEEQDLGEQEGERDDQKDLIQEICTMESSQGKQNPAFEKEKSALVNLLQTIKGIDGMLAQITSRKLQYQKG